MTVDESLVLRMEYKTEVDVDDDGDILISQESQSSSEPDVVIVSPERLSRIIAWLRDRGIKV